MFRPLLTRRAALRLVPKSPGKIDPRADWSRLAPGPQADGEPPPGPALELLSCAKTDRPGLLHDHGHAWIRIWDGAGRYVSAGFYPDESTRIDPEDVPGLRFPGMLLSPDKYDRIDWPGRSTRIALTEAQRLALIGWVEGLQARRMQGALGFDLIERNCVAFVVEAAAEVGVRVEAEVTLLGLLAGGSGAPGPAGRIFGPLRRLVFKLGIAVLGGRRVLTRQWRRGPEGPQAAEVAGIRPVFATPREVLTRRLPFLHVRGLMDWQARQAGPARAAPPALAEPVAVRREG
jgi:hypothetical protein